MRINELFEASSAASDMPKMLAIINQMASGIEDTGSKTPIDIGAIIKTLNSSGINITAKDFRELFDQGEFEDVISGIEGSKVSFIGQSSGSNPALKPDQTTSTLEKMAKRATKKRD